MFVGEQIKKCRMLLKLSQDELADKIYVSRQTISNWENSKSYPDIKSLMLLSDVFEISVDELIKGDVEQMRKEINEFEHQHFGKNCKLLTLMFILVVFCPLPLFLVGKWYSVALYAFIWSGALYYALKVEIYKKKYDIYTYKEILTFTEGNHLDKIEKAREEGKRYYQRVLLVLCSFLLGCAVYVIMGILIKYIAI